MLSLPMVRDFRKSEKIGISLISRPVHELMAAHCYNLVPQHEIHKFNNQPTIWWWMMENVQISRKAQKCAKNCILIREIQWRKCHPDTWSGNFKNVRIS